MVAVTAALVGFFAFVIMRVTTPQMTTLFTDLCVEDSSGIIKDLERQGIQFELRNDGAIIMVPKDKVTRLRMKLAEGGLPKGGGVGYEIFDKSDALGTTCFVQNINHLRALEGELARTIRAIDRIQAARVHLVLPERPLFSRETPEPSASIVVRVRGALEPQQIRAIRHLVASAVNGLKPQRVSIVDEAGQLLADGAADRSESSGRRRAPHRLREADAQAGRGHRLLRGRPRPRPRPALRRFRLQQDHPDLGQVRSGRPRAALEPDPRRAEPTAEQQRPGHRQQRVARQPANSGADGRADQSKKSEETNNYEISRTTKTEVTEAGRVNRISVAVLVDGIYSKNDKGEMVYQDRTKEQLDRIAAAGALGDRLRPEARRPGRGRQSALCRGASIAPIAEPTGLLGMLQFTKDDVMYFIELGVMMLLGLVVLFLVIRPLVKRILASDEVAAALSGALTGPAAAQREAAGADRPGAAAEQRREQRSTSPRFRARSMPSPCIASANSPSAIPTKPSPSSANG